MKTKKRPPLKLECLNQINKLRKDSWLFSEAGLYSLLFRSNKSKAKQFKRWVTHEVLPSILKTGHYGIHPASLSPFLQIKTLLTGLPMWSMMKLPNYRRRSRRLCHSPLFGKKSGFSCFCHQNTSKGVGYILVEQRPGVREAPAAFDKPGSVVLPFFISNSQIIEVHHV